MSNVKIAESQHSTLEILNIHWKGVDGEMHEKWVNIHRNEKGEILSVKLDSKEIMAFELDILAFLREKKKL